MRCAIMQPTYLPWLGWFDLMDQVDHFILLDDVQFSRRSWQQRNRIRVKAGLQWLTVPVMHEPDGEPLLMEARLADPAIARKHWATVRREYAGAAHAAALLPAFEAAWRPDAPWTLLTELNVAHIETLRTLLRIRTPVSLASAFAAGGTRGAHLAELCARVGARTYVSAPGSLAYLGEDREAFTARGIAVTVHRYEHPTYAQRHPGFEPFASALDAVLNLGPAAADVMREGRRAAQPLDEALAAVAAAA
ncbi:MAG: WbqC family protein [Gemmatimonadales bacterium]|nr:WbqC family protein [Gemmatimonadales bacterium]